MAVSPHLGFDLPYDGQQNVVTTIAAALLAIEAAAFNAPKVHVYHNANQSIANATATALAFNSERFDSHGMHSTSTNTPRVAVIITGHYIIGGTAQYAANATGCRSVLFRVDGTTFIPGTQQIQAVTEASRVTEVTGVTEYPLTAGQYVEMMAFQSSGGSLNVISAGNRSPEFWMVKVG